MKAASPTCPHPLPLSQRERGVAADRAVPRRSLDESVAGHSAGQRDASPAGRASSRFTSGSRPSPQAMKRWRQQQVSYLQQTGQAQEAMKLWKQLAADYPHDSGLLATIRQRLGQSGEHETAYRLLREALGGKIEWQPYEEESLRSTYCQLMQSQGRWAEMADVPRGVAQTQSRDVDALRAILGALVRLDKLDEANRLAAEWLAEGQVRASSRRLRRPACRRPWASCSATATASTSDRLDEQWLRPLADAAIFFARHETQGHVADRIMGDGRFTQTDQCRRVRKAAVEMLRDEIDRSSRRRSSGWSVGPWRTIRPSSNQWRTDRPAAAQALGRGEESRRSSGNWPRRWCKFSPAA